MPGPLDWYITLYTAKQTIGVVATARHGNWAWDYGKDDDSKLEDIKKVKSKLPSCDSVPIALDEPICWWRA